VSAGRRGLDRPTVDEPEHLQALVGLLGGTAPSRTLAGEVAREPLVGETDGSRTSASSTKRTRYQLRSFKSDTAAPRLTVSTATLFSNGSSIS